MSTKPSLITRVIVSAAAVGSIATGIAVPVVTVIAPAAGVGVVMSPDYTIHQG